MKKMRKIRESSAQQLSNAVKVLKTQLEEKQEGLEVNNNNVVETVEHVKRGDANIDDTQSIQLEREGEENLGNGDDALPELGEEVDCEHDIDE